MNDTFSIKNLVGLSNKEELNLFDVNSKFCGQTEKVINLIAEWKVEWEDWIWFLQIEFRKRKGFWYLDKFWILNSERNIFFIWQYYETGKNRLKIIFNFSFL